MSTIVKKHLLVIATFLGTIVCVSTIQAALTFNLTEGPGLMQLRVDNPTLAAGFRSGFDTAAANWSSQFTDAVVLNYTIDVDTLAPGVLGGATPASNVFSYSTVRNALIADSTTATDASVVSNLVNATSIDFLTNDRTGASVVDTDNSPLNSFLSVSRSNAKALGLLNPNSILSDASITFSETFSFDFDQSDGITSGQFDFVGIATHEIGHALGFISGVDTVDVFSGSGDRASDDLNDDDPGLGTLDGFAVFNTLDLLRFSPESLAVGPGVNDLSFDNSPFFSIDGGATNLVGFETGNDNGSGNQASHFVGNNDIFGPTFAPGSLRTQSTLDLTAIDAIGFDLALATAVPEPSLGFFLAIATGLIPLRRRAR